MNLKSYFEEVIINILKKQGHIIKNAMVTCSNRPDLSDYQSNIAMSLAKQLKKSPITIANEITKLLSENKNLSQIRVDGPGFINVRFSNEFLEKSPSIEKFSNKKIIIDYGGPNIAKEMHVGHLRSAIIGESLKRILKYCGDEVIADVHFGDWGTPIGMLITQLQQEQINLFSTKDNINHFNMTISEISDLYRRASNNFKTNEQFQEKARIATFELQNGNQTYRTIWKIIHDKSIDAVKEIYDKLDVSFDLWLGESDTNDLLDIIVKELLDKKIAIYSEGAIIVPLDSSKAPLILRKSDGAYTYAATDLATIKQRETNFKPDAILYVVDARQKEHFEQVFTVARLGKLIRKEVMLEHIAFGTVNGKDGKPFKTREGNVMNLKDLIELSEKKAEENISPNLNKDDLHKQIHQIAIGSLKFQDLKNVRTSNYIFDTENFTNSEGKTGAYIQYAVARINSILEKSNINEFKEELKITHTLEREILLQLHRFSENLIQCYNTREPSILCEYLYSLAQKFSSLYAELPINKESDINIKCARLKLIEIIREVLVQGLNLLGIESPEKMLKRK